MSENVMDERKFEDETRNTIRYDPWQNVFKKKFFISLVNE